MADAGNERLRVTLEEFSAALQAFDDPVVDEVAGLRLMRSALQERTAHLRAQVTASETAALEVLVEAAPGEASGLPVPFAVGLLDTLQEAVTAAGLALAARSAAQPDRTARSAAQPDRTARSAAQPDRTARSAAQPDRTARSAGQGQAEAAAALVLRLTAYDSERLQLQRQPGPIETQLVAPDAGELLVERALDLVVGVLEAARDADVLARRAGELPAPAAAALGRLAGLLAARPLQLRLNLQPGGMPHRAAVVTRADAQALSAALLGGDADSEASGAVGAGVEAGAAETAGLAD